MEKSANYRVFYSLLGNSLLASVTNMFVWFALTFWVFLETNSVLATSYVAGIFAVSNMVSSLFFGVVVDHYRKKTAMVLSSLISLIAYVLGTALYFGSPDTAFHSASSITLWSFVLIMMLGSVAGNLRTIALNTTVTMLFTEDRDKVNGLIGTVTGMSFAITSILSGFAIGWYGMGVATICALIAIIITTLHLFTVRLPEPEIVHLNEPGTSKVDLRGTIAAIAVVPGLFALIFFTTFNNFLGGVFMALMDAYGLTLMSVKSWGVLLAVMSFGFILGSTIIAKYGLGKNPVQRLMMTNVIAWLVCIFFTIQPSVILLAIGMLIWMTLVPFMEASEQTILQKVVPFERQGRVMGFAHSVESAASPVTTFLIGPIAQFIFIPFMTTGAGVALIGDWFGVGVGRGIALVFITVGLIGLVVTLLAFRSGAYRALSKHYLEN